MNRSEHPSVMILSIKGESVFNWAEPSKLIFLIGKHKKLSSLQIPDLGAELGKAKKYEIGFGGHFNDLFLWNQR